ncbi:MAG: putative type II secretion system protein D [Chlamydiae bacterium]|nr:putative type II secretion system protein D [Chlamydiota bacterium]
MKRKTSSKIFYFSILVALCSAQSIPSSESQEHLWNFGEENTDSPTDVIPVESVVKQKSSTPVIIDTNTPEIDDSEWEIDWNLDLSEEKTQEQEKARQTDGISTAKKSIPTVIPAVKETKTNNDASSGQLYSLPSPNNATAPATLDQQAEGEENIQEQSAQKKPDVKQENEANPPTSTIDETVVQVEDRPDGALSTTGQFKTPPKTILINFNNVGIIEYIRFISRITNRNFVFDESDLQFNVTIISEEPTTLENVITALIQELRIHDLSLIEEGNNFIIHKNDQVRSISRVNVDDSLTGFPRESELVTQVFKLNTLDPEKAATIISPLLSAQALIETSRETQHIILTDLVTNVKQVDTLLKSIDSPKSGHVIGQYVVRNAFIDNLIELAQEIMGPIAQDQPLVFVPHPAAGSIFIVSSPFLVERTISVLQHLDDLRGTTRIYDLDELRLREAPTREVPPEGVRAPEGRWELSPQGERIFRPAVPTEETPRGEWLLDPQGNWYFLPEGKEPPFERRKEELLPEETPRGQWLQDVQGSWVFQIPEGDPLQPIRLVREAKIREELPVGHIDRTKFFIHKLQFRKGEDIVNALQRIGDSLQLQELANTDLVLTIQSVQWIETSNSLVFTGTDATIAKVKELIEEIDSPLRQVFIEMLILETDIDDSLTYGVTWGTRSGGGSTSTAQAFLGGASPLIGALATGGLSSAVPEASSLATAAGYHLGIIGQRLTHNGTQFATMGALVTALHQQSNTNIVLNPKIITEDNKTAEIFVGINTRFQTQAVSNDEGSIITNNFEFRDVGTTLNVTPLIGNNDIITLEIQQEVSRTTGGGGGGGTGDAEGEVISDVSPGPTTSINRTTTTVHIPDKHFVIISGMIDDTKVKSRNQFPCLGGIPIIGAAGSSKTIQDTKRNLMIFIRPQIIDTAEEFSTLTRQQQENLKQKNRQTKSWKYEVEHALDFMNIKRPCCEDCE